MKLSITTGKKYTILTLADRIEWEDARDLDETIKRLTGEGVFHIAFDLNSVSYICSAGIGALVYNLNTVRKNGGAIYIITSNEYIEYMFQTLKFDMVFDGHIYATPEEFIRKVIDSTKAAQ